MSQNSQRFQISEIKTPVLPMNLNMELQSSRNQIQMPIYEKMKTLLKSSLKFATKRF